MITDEDRMEAERLALLTRNEQRQIIAFYRDVARGKGVPAAERKAGLSRADALEKLLNLKPKKPRKD